MNEGGKAGPHEHFIGALGRERVFRDRRFDRRNLKGLDHELVLRNGSEAFAARIENFSSGGMALSFKQTGPSVTEGGKVEVRLLVDGEEVYAGPLLVREVTVSGEDTLLRGEFSGPPLDVEKIFDFKLESDLRRLADTDLDMMLKAAVDGGVSEEYKREVERFKTFLLLMKEFLETAESRIERERPGGAEEIKRGLLEHVTRAHSATYESLCDRLNEHTRRLDEKGRTLYRIYTQRVLCPIAIESPFCRQAYYKPLGYAGDYECMRLITKGIDEGSTLYEKFLNHCVGMLRMARMVRSRGEYIKDRIASFCRAREDGGDGADAVKIMSVACGPATEISDLVEDGSFRPAVPVQFFLVDQDDNALAYCYRHLKSMLYRRSERLRAHFLHVSIKQIIEEKDIASRIGGVDFVYTMGMMDYMPDWIAERIIDSLFTMLNPGGVLYVGNIRPGIETNWIAEFLFDWRLSYRSEEELMRLASNVKGAPAAEVSVDAEELGYNLFLVARKGP